MTAKKGKDVSNVAKMDEPGTEVALPEQGPSIMGMIAEAVKDPTFDADKLEQLIALKNSEADRDAKRAFNDAMYEFHQDPPEIKKTKPVYGKDISKGAQYHHADFGKAVKAIRPKLRAVGITVTWSSEPLEAGVTKVTCILRHTMGHEEKSSMAAAPETGGSKNAVQGVGSADSYLRRYTLLSVTGLVAEDEDTDGVVDDAPIDEERVAFLQEKAEETGTDIPALCKAFKIDSLPELPQGEYYRALGMMEEKRKRADSENA